MRVLESGIQEVKQGLAMTEEGPAIVTEEMTVVVRTTIVPLTELLDCGE